MPTKTDPGERYRVAFEELETSGDGRGGSDRIRRARQEAMDRFATLGFPTRKVEDWKYTDVRPIASGAFQPTSQIPATDDAAVRAALEALEIPGLSGPRLVFVDGYLSLEHSDSPELPEGGVLCGLAQAIEAGEPGVEEHLAAHAPVQDDAFTALNTAFLRDGVFLRLPQGAELEGVVQVFFLSSARGGATLSTPRNLYLLDEGASANVIEIFGALGEDAYLTNTVSEAHLEPGARLDHCKIGQEGEQGYHVGTIRAHQLPRSRFRNYTVTLSGSIVRNNIGTVLDGEKCIARLDGVYYAKGHQVIDNYTSVDHAKPDCNSFELYKGIVDGRATGVFNGRIYVHQDAQKTDAKQSNAGLLLTEDATINSKPQLEIFADDVKCTHGATVGFLDKDALFYLRSRGLGKEEARDLLTFAFANEVLERIPFPRVREHLGERIVLALTEGRRVRGGSREV